MQRGFVVMSVSFEDLAQREVLEPRVLFRRLHLERPPRQEDGVVEVLQVEEDSREVEQDVRVVRGDGESFTEALDRYLRVALDSPEVPYLVEDLR